ncbi:MAG: Uma2 family endonuclease [Spirochaetaceae bacterium]|nr:Uma2 family endonuclease [Spirochaetaceae bacterium]
MSEILTPQYYTVEDYYNLPEDTPRCELDEGILLMSPAPSTKHQNIYSKFYLQLANYFEDKPCQVFQDIDVQLFKDEDTIYRPDILVVCDHDKIGRQKVLGAPDFVIEIASPGTMNRYFGQKRLAYERAGVKEYWVIKSLYLIYVYLLNDDGLFRETIYKNQPTLKVHSFEGLVIDLERIQKAVDKFKPKF